MNIATQILLDELIENSHIENVSDVIFWALAHYKKEHPMYNGGILASYLIKRIEEAEEKGKAELQNPELIESLNK